MPPDPLYVASVAETVQSALRNTDDPTEIRRYLYELRDILHETEFEGDLADELHDNLDQHIDLLNSELNKSVGETRRSMIIDDVHRVERFCQRRDSGGTSEQSDDDTPTKLADDVTINIGTGGDDVSASSGGDTTDDDDGFDWDTWANVRDEAESAWQDDDQWNSDFLGTGDADRDAWNLDRPFGSTTSILRNGSDWPTYRRDLHRQGADSDIGTFGEPSRDWESSLHGDPLGEPAVLSETLVVPTKTNGLLFLDRATGRQQSQFDPGSDCYTSPVVYDGTAYCGFDDGLYAVDRWGTRRWKHSTNDWVRTVPLAFDGIIFFGDSGGNFYAVDADTGRLEGSFKYQPSSYESAFEVSPAIHEGTIIAGTSFRALGIDYETGRLDWTKQIEVDQNSSSSKAPAIADGTAYYPGKDAVYALDPTTGVVEWQADISDYGKVQSAVAVRDDAAYVSTNEFDGGGYLHRIEPPGRITRTHSLASKGATSPAVTAFGVIVGTLEGPIERYEGSGSFFPEWTIEPTDRWTRAAPIIDDGVLYVSFGSSLYAYS